MKKIRKGNDIEVRWAIYAIKDGQSVPYDLEGKNINIYFKSRNKLEKAEDISVDGNVVQFYFYGKNQINLGVYSIVFVENEGEKGMHTIDECDVFELVSCTCEAENNDEVSSVDIEPLEFKTSAELGVPGMIGGGGAITLLLPNDDTFYIDNSNAEFLANNKAAFKALEEQTTEPLLIFMRYLGHNILCNPTMRVCSNLSDVKPYFDYTYLVLSDGVVIGAGIAYRFYADGTVAKVDSYGNIITSPNPIISDFAGTYYHSYNGKIINTEINVVLKDSENGLFEIDKTLFGNSSFSTMIAALDMDAQTFTILSDGHYLGEAGTVHGNIVMDVVVKGIDDIKMVARGDIIGEAGTISGFFLSRIVE